MDALPGLADQMNANLRAAAATGNLSAWQQTIQYGYDMIDQMYQPHPIKRPFDLMRRNAARRDWEQQVRLTGVQLRAAMMEAALREFKTKLNRPMDQADWEFTEHQRRAQMEFDIDQQIRLAEATARANARAQGDLQQQAADLNRQPDLGAQIDTFFAKMAEIEHDPTLTEDERDRRLAWLREQQHLQFGPGRK